MSESFPRYFNASDLGASLQEVAGDLIRTSNHEVISRWFHSPKDVDLFIWLDSKRNILKQQLSFYGQVVEWNVVEGVKTGLIIEQQQKKAGRPGGSEIVRFDLKAQRAPVDQAVALLEKITVLKDEERKALVLNFAAPTMGSSLAPEEFIHRFGAFLERPSSMVVPSTQLQRLFSRIRRWFS